MSSRSTQRTSQGSLAPVRVRGQKKRKLQASYALEARQEPSPQHHRLHPNLQKLAMRRHLSSLELLPAEILEHIFRHVLDFNLPQSSPVIAHKLSHRRVYVELGTQLFRDFNAKYGRDGDKTFVWESALALFSRRNMALQCRWMTLDIFSEIWNRCLEENRVAVIRHNTAPGVWLGRGCRIPRKLLKWPVTEENFRFIQMLLSAGCRVDWIRTFDGELATETFFQALRNKCYRVVHIFMAPGINVQPAENDLISTLRAIDWDIPMIRLLSTSLFCFRGDFRVSPILPISLPMSAEMPLTHPALRQLYPHAYQAIRARLKQATQAQKELDLLPDKEFHATWMGRPCVMNADPATSPCGCARSLLGNFGAWHSLDEEIEIPV